MTHTDYLAGLMTERQQHADQIARIDAAIATVAALADAEISPTPQNTPVVKPEPTREAAQPPASAPNGRGAAPSGRPAGVRPAQGKSGGSGGREMSDVRRAVLEAVRRWGPRGSITVAGIVEATGLTAKQVANAVSRLRNAGLIEQVERGFWRAVQAQTDAPEFDVTWSGTRERRGEAPTLSSVGRTA